MTAGRQRWGDVAFVAAVVGALYAVLWQGYPFAEEPLWFEQARRLEPASAPRPLWRALLARAHHWPGADTFGPHVLVSWCNAVCVALGLFALGAAVRRRMPGAGARGVLLSVAACPAVLCFATSAMPFAAVFSTAGLALCIAAWPIGGGSRGAAAALAGAAAGAGHVFDDSALLQPLWLVPLVLVLARRDGLPRAARLRAAALTLGGFALAVSLSCIAGLAPPPNAVLTAGHEAHARDVVNLAIAVGKEGLRSYLPLSLVIVWCALGNRSELARPLVWAGVLGAAASAWMHGARAMEGAVLLSLALPAGFVVAEAVGPRLRAALIVVGALLGGLKLHALARDGHPRAFLAGLRAEVPAADPVLLTSADGADRIASALWLPRASAASVADLVLLGADPANDLPALVRRHLHQHFAEDRRVFLTLEAETALRHRPSYDRHPAVAALLQTLLEDFTVVQRDRGAFRAKELLPKRPR